MANILTISRMVFSLILLLPPAFSISFAVIYFLAGLTDMLDGWVARKTETACEAGARLDTVADMVLVIVCLMKLLPVVVLPTYLWIWTAAIGAIKIVNVISGFVTQQKFVAVHSILNRLTGLLLFLLPLTLAIVEIKYTGSVVCIIATLAAIQEGHRIRTKSKGDTRYGTDRYKPMEQHMMVGTDRELYRTLSQLTKDKSLWKENLPNVAALLKNHSPKLTAKAMWLLRSGFCHALCGPSVRGTIDALLTEWCNYKNDERSIVMDFSEVLKDILKCSNIKVYNLTSFLGYDASYVSKWLSGARRPTEGMIGETAIKLPAFASAAHLRGIWRRCAQNTDYTSFRPKARKRCWRRSLSGLITARTFSTVELKSRAGRGHSAMI